MKHLIFCVMTLFFASYNAQDQVQPDARLLEVYSQEYLNKIGKDQPHIIEFFNYKLDNSYQVVDLEGKTESMDLPLLSTVLLRRETEDSNIATDALDAYRNNNLNVLNYSFANNKVKKSFYLIDGTTNALMFYSNDELLKNFKEFKNYKQ